MNQKRARTDGAKGLQEIVSGANVILPVPECCDLHEKAKVFWASLSGSKATRGWTESDLIMLVNLCNTLSNIKYWREELNGLESHIIENGAGTLVAHPYVGMIDTAEKRARMYHSHLQLHPQATQGAPGKQAEQNKTHNDAKGGDLEDDGLCATPKH